MRILWANDMYPDDDKIKVQVKEQNEYNLRRWREFRLTANILPVRFARYLKLRKLPCSAQL